MITKRFLISLLLGTAFLVPSLGQAWSFIDAGDSLNKSTSSCWQIVKVQDQTCVGEDCPESAELPPAEDEEPDCE